MKDALAGDRAAMGQLLANVIVPAIQRRLGYRLMLSGADRATLSDHVHEVLVHLLERDAEALRRWDPARGPIGPYVAKIAANLVISRLRKRPPPSPTDEIECEAAASPSPEQNAAYHYLVARVLRDLGENDAILFHLIFLEELSPDEAAAELGISRDAVHKRIQRLRVKVAELLSSPAAVAT